ncbi:conserved hypothetical protein, partial [Ricinus communis]
GRGGGDEAVDQHRTSPRGRAQHRPGHHGDLAAAELRQHRERILGVAAGGGAGDGGGLAGQAFGVVSGALADAGVQRRRG